MENVNTYQSRENSVMNGRSVVIQLQQISHEGPRTLSTSVHCGPHMELLSSQS